MRVLRRSYQLAFFAVLAACNDPLPMTDARDAEAGQFFGPIPASFRNSLTEAEFMSELEEAQRALAPALRALTLPEGVTEAETAETPKGLDNLPDLNRCAGLRHFFGDLLVRSEMKNATAPQASLSLTGGQDCRGALQRLGSVIPEIAGALEAQTSLNRPQLTDATCVGLTTADWKSSKAAIGYEMIRRLGSPLHALDQFDVRTFRGGIEGGGDGESLALRTEVTVHSQVDYKRYHRKSYQWAGLAIFIEPGARRLTVHKVENLSNRDSEKGRKTGQERLHKRTVFTLSYGEEPVVEETTVFTYFENGKPKATREVALRLTAGENAYALKIQEKPSQGDESEAELALTIAKAGDEATCVLGN